MQRPLSSLRPFGPFIQYNASSFTSDQDARDINEAITEGTPAEMSESVYQDRTDNPTLYISFEIPSENEITESRDMITSAITVSAESRRISEATIRFPKVSSRNASKSEITQFVKKISPDLYRVRINDYIEDGTQFYYPHVHYSTRRRGEEGPVIGTQVMKLNKMIKDWYGGG
jgi:hypothetical protein